MTKISEKDSTDAELIKIIESISSGICASVITSYSSESPEIIYANDLHEKLTEYHSFELIAKNPKLFQGKNTDRSLVEKTKKCLHEINFWEGEIINYTKSGKEYKIKLTIFGITYNKIKYYVAFKTKTDSIFNVIYNKFVNFKNNLLSPKA